MSFFRFQRPNAQAALDYRPTIAGDKTDVVAATQKHVKTANVPKSQAEYTTS